MGSLEGKIALVTGAARGIGRATALALAAEGAQVGVADIQEEVKAVSEEIEKLGGKSTYTTFDVSDESAVNKGFNLIKKQLGAIDILVNNAGIYTNVKEIRKMPKENWDREIAINLTGAFLCIKAVLDDMIEKKWGRIINISSVAGKLGWYGVCSYAASKAGLLGLTKTVALEHARDGITCNAVLPGLIKTKAYDLFREDVRERIINRIPSKEAGNPEDIAHVVAFLALEKARYINGAEIDVSAGAGLFTF